jgi:hypothetical protein
LKCSKCDHPIEIERPEPESNYAGGACCLNEACEMFEVDVWAEYVDLHLDEDGNMPVRRWF